MGGDPIFPFHLLIICNQSAKTIKNLSMRNILKKNQHFVLHRNTHKKVAPLKALLLGRTFHFF